MDMAGGVVEVLHIRLGRHTLTIPLAGSARSRYHTHNTAQRAVEAGKNFERLTFQPVYPRIRRVMAGPGRAGAVVLSWQSELESMNGKPFYYFFV